MSIHEVPMFKVYCDGCKREAEESTDYYAWADAEQAVDGAKEHDWSEHGGKHYCPDCFCFECEKPGHALPIEGRP